MAVAEPGQILARESTASAALGSEVELMPSGRHDLKDLPGSWDLYLI